MPGLKGLCSVCQTGQKLTPKNGNVVKHSGPDATNGTYAAPTCKGSGKTPVLVRPCVCDSCGQDTLFRADGVMARHRKRGEETWCKMEMGEAAMTLKEQLGAVEVPSSDSTSGYEAAPPTPTSGRDSSQSIAQPAPSNGPSMTFSNGESTPTAPSIAQMFGDEPTDRVRAKPRKRVPLEGEALALSDWFDDLFFRYQHSRPRSLQPTIGPSEIGSACMRKIAMKLSRRPEVNFEKDTYAAWLGTQGHLGVEEMLRWANAQMGVERFLIEAELEFGSTAMPHGHSDAFDRLTGTTIDWKFPGTSALSKMHLDGPPDDYRTQLHLYSYGQRMSGENVERVALIALPRQSGDLSGKYVFVEPYDESIALAAIKKAEAIKGRLVQYAEQGVAEPWKLAPKTPSYLCAFCSFYLANDAAERRGCNGKA